MQGSHSSPPITPCPPRPRSRSSSETRSCTRVLMTAGMSAPPPAEVCPHPNCRSGCAHPCSAFTPHCCEPPVHRPGGLHLRVWTFLFVPASGYGGTTAWNDSIHTVHVASCRTPARPRWRGSSRVFAPNAHRILLGCIYLPPPAKQQL